jgi:hypothetical protein
LITIIAGVDLIALFFLCPETQYPRDLHKAMDAAAALEHASTDEEAPEESPEATDLKASSSEHKDVTAVPLTNVPTTASTVSRSYQKKTFLQELIPWSGIRRDKSLLAAFLRPLPLLLYPSIIWASLCFGINVSW